MTYYAVKLNGSKGLDFLPDFEADDIGELKKDIVEFFVEKSVAADEIAAFPGLQYFEKHEDDGEATSVTPLGHRKLGEEIEHEYYSAIRLTGLDTWVDEDQLLEMRVYKGEVV